MKNLSKLQKKLYTLLKEYTDPTLFNENYKEFMSNIPRASQKYYDKEFVFDQGYVKGTPRALSYDKMVETIKKAGYKQVTTDRTWISLNKVMDVLYANLF